MQVKWSHSALKDFENCPRRYHEVKVLKNYPFPDTEQIRYGKELHKAAEDYVRDGTALPEQFAFVKPAVDALLLKPGRRYPELEMALTVDLTPCDFKDDNVWVRGIVDLLIVDDDNLTAWLVDYKTGSNKYPDIGQLELMSLLVFANFPHIRQVNSALLFVVKESMVKHKMSVDEAPAAWQRYRERIAKLAACHSNNVWNPTQTPLCGWCPVKTCEFNPKH
jgi:CRISPR/Cas system-associated exonuclease Cas4 (RecB family)